MKSDLSIIFMGAALPDYDLLVQQLRRQRPVFACVRVESREELTVRLREGGWDILLLGHRGAGQDLASMLLLIRQYDPDLPVILLADHMAEEDVVEHLKQGISDLVFRDNPARLASVIERSLQEARDRRDRRQAEKLLVEEVERRRHFMAQSRDGVVVLDRGGLVREANQRFADLLGYTLEEVGRLHVWDWDARWSREDVLKEVAKIDDAGKLFETRFRCRDGSLLDVEVGASLFREQGGDHIYCVCRDIGPRHQARQDLEEKLRLQDQLMKVAASVPGVIYSFRLRPDGTNCFPYASPPLLDIFGLSAGDLVSDGSPVFNAIHPEDRAGLQADIDESARTLSPWHGEFRIRHPTQGEVWLEGQSLPQREPDGGTLWHGFVTNVTERKRARQALEQSRERYQILFESMQEGCAYCRMIEDENGRPDFVYLDVNPSFERLTGLKDVKGRRVSEVVPGIRETNPELMELYRRVAHGGAPELFEDYVGPLKLWFSVSVYSPAPAHFVAVFDVITSRKEAEIALRQSEERYRSTLDSMMEGCQIIGFEGQYIYINQSATRYGQKRREELLGRKMVEVFPGFESTALYADIMRCLSTRESLQAQHTFAYDQGDTRWFDLHMHPVPEGLFILSIDITERKRAQAELRRSEERLTLAIAIAQLGVWELNLATMEILCSPECQAIFGWRSDRISREQYIQCLHPDDRARVLKQAEDAVVSGQDFAREYRVVRPDGQVRWVSDRGHVRRQESGQPLFIVGTAKDITERKKSEEGIRLQSAALEAAANAIVITDRDGTIQWANPAFSGVTGFSVDEAIGKNPRALIKSGEQDAAFYETLWDTILAGRVWRGEVINRRKDGSLYTEEMTITPVRDARGEIVHFIAIKQDITDHKNLEAQLLRTQRLESVGRLASGIAHDLNNILSPMLLGPPILRETLQDSTALEIVNAIESSAQRGAAIIKQLLTFGRGLEAQRVPIQLKSLVRDMMKLIAETFPKNIVARTALPADLLLVNGDATQLHQVLMNLCVNARDAMPDGGQLTLALTAVDVDESLALANAEAQVGRHVVLSVSDTGAGIDPEHMDKIFDPFFTTKSVGEGTGLGLSTVLGIVRSHKGFIQVDSEPGRGTEFRIFLPASAVGHDGAARAADVPLPQGRGETVLLVDDEETVRRVSRRMLEQNGYNVLEAANGREALEVLAARGGLVKVILTDLLMPVMDGPAFIRESRRGYPGLPLVSMSGCLTHPELMQALETETQAFLAKPFSASALLTTLQQVLRA